MGFPIFAGMDAVYMRRCLELARLGLGNASPNPLVGCVIVENNRIIGEGFHVAVGQPHAEVNAIRNVGDKSLLKHATLYVNLEPCAHFGKTPPCAPLMVSYQIPRVVIANRDPFAEVDGRGISILENAGIDVDLGYEREAGEFLNRRFFTFHRKNRPFVILKMAQSVNGFLDRDRKPDEKGVNWISQPQTQYLTHKWRNEEDAILIGTRTALLDNPSLTVRRLYGRNPVRLLIDRKLKVPTDSKIFSLDARTVVFNERVEKTIQNTSWVKLDFANDVIRQILHWMQDEKLQSLIVEGGSETLKRFTELGLWDEARIITGTNYIKSGVPAPQIDGKLIESYRFGEDRINVIQRIT